jgi:hypothetical protein
MRFAELTEGGQATFSAAHKGRKVILHSVGEKGNLPKADFIVSGAHSLLLGKFAASLSED